MQILTNRLVALHGDALPLPWYHRAPLGLMTGTAVHATLQRPRQRAFGDLLVTVVDPAKWPFVWEVDAARPDAPGVLADVYQLAPPLNIVLGESATVDSGSRHEARLILEPVRPFYPPTDAETIKHEAQQNIQKIKNGLKELGFKKRDSQRIHPDEEPGWMDGAIVHHGWAPVEGWRHALAAQAANAPTAHEYDLSMAVVSADTNRRVLRYVFPRSGALSVAVTHADEPGAAAEIARALASTDLNVLSSLLRRGASPSGKSEIVLVVEPGSADPDPASVEPKVRAALRQLPIWSRVKLDISGPVDPEQAVLYPRHPDEIAVRPSPGVAIGIREERRRIPKGKRPIFISRRFVDHDEYNRNVVAELTDVLVEFDCVPVQALPQRAGQVGVPEAVQAKMWASEAAILLATSTPDKLAFSHNLAHEWGFMQGQGKPFLPLVEDGVWREVSGHPNFQGNQLTLFSKVDYANRQQPGSIHAQVGPWLATLGQPATAGQDRDWN